VKKHRNHSAVLGMALVAIVMFLMIPQPYLAILGGAVAGFLFREVQGDLWLAIAQPIKDELRTARRERERRVQESNEIRTLLAADFSRLIIAARVQNENGRWETGRNVGVLMVDCGLCGRKGDPIFFGDANNQEKDRVTAYLPWPETTIELINKNREPPFFSVSTPIVGVPLSEIFISPTFPIFAT